MGNSRDHWQRETTRGGSGEETSAMSFFAHLRHSAFICGQNSSHQFRNPEIISPVLGFSSVKPCGSVCSNFNGAGGLVPFKARAR